MPDDRIFDAINLFKYSRSGQGTANVGGDARYQARYRQLAGDVIQKLWRLWSAGDIGFVTFSRSQSSMGRSGPDRIGFDIKVNRRVEPSRDPATYTQTAEQGKLAACSCIFVHEATHLVRRIVSIPEEEVLCRTIEQLYFRELKVGCAHDSRVTGTRLTAQYTSSVPYFSEYTDRDARFTNSELIDNVFTFTEYREDLESRATAAFIVRSFPWWGGLTNRWPSTRGYYLRSLAARAEDYSEPILQILESLDQGKWAAARSCAGNMGRVRQALRLPRHRGEGIRIGSQLSYSDPFSDRVRMVEGRLGESFGGGV